MVEHGVDVRLDHVYVVLLPERLAVGADRVGANGGEVDKSGAADPYKQQNIYINIFIYIYIYVEGGSG